jgi:protein-tyrosine-phosphatase/DNA-binding transcriptional ArsR family regulator
MYYAAMPSSGAASPAPSSPPTFLALAGHPLRWRLLGHLARSDLRVRELEELLEERQSVISYHLGLLRSAGMVLTRQSSADHRDRYYAADLRRCAELLGLAASTLHPGLQRLHPLVPVDPPPRLSGRVLFLCTANSARSQMAEALLQQYAGGAIDVMSAGSHPTQLHPNTVRVLAARGIDVSGRRAKHLDEFVGEHFDCVVTVCDRVREVCPAFPGARRMIHWSIADPAESGDGDGDGDEASLAAFERAVRELAERVPFLVHLLAHQTLEDS